MSRENTQQDRQIDLRVVKGADGVSEFDECWDDLFSRAVDATPYLSRSWVSTFVREGRIKGVPVFVLAFSGTKLLGLLPLVVRTFLTVKIAEPIGVGEASYFGVLYDSEYPSVIECMADLIASEGIFDVYLNTFLSTSDRAANDLLAALVQKGYFCQQIHRDPCCYIQLGCSFDEYFNKCISSRSRHTLRRKERRLLRNSDVRFEYYIGKEITNEILSRVAIVQEESWMKRRGVAVLGQKFYQKFLLQMAEAGLGRLWLMTIDGVDAAFQYAFVAHNKLYFRWTAFRLRYESLSPGHSLMMHVIRESCDNNDLWIDLGPGEAEYKRFWASHHFDVNRAIAGKGLMGRLITMCYYSAWRLAKIKCLHSSYRRIKRILRRSKPKVTVL